MLAVFPVPADAAPYESYQYDYYGYAVSAPAPYLPERALTGLDLGSAISISRTICTLPTTGICTCSIQATGPRPRK